MEQLQEQPGVMSRQEYFDFLENAEQRHEFHALADDPERGVVVAMAGTTEPHAVINANLGGLLHAALRGSRCRHMSNEMRVFAPGGHPKRRGGGKHLFPDASVRCGEPHFAGEDLGENEGSRMTLLNPVAIFEILSPSSEKDDLSTKFQAYANIPSFREYVVLHQDRPFVETRNRREDGMLALRFFEAPPAGESEAVRLESLSISLPLADLYADVVFPEEPQPEAEAVAAGLEAR